MTIELISAFCHNCDIPKIHHKSLEKIFAKQLASYRKYIDKVTILDTDWGITEIPGEVIKRPLSSHWANMQFAAQRSKADVLLLVDQDMLIYEPKVIQFMKKEMETNEYCGMLDGSRKHLFGKNVFRSERSRFTPYLCMIKRSAVLENGADFDPDEEHDSMGKMTEYLLNNHSNFGISEMPDDRFSSYLRDGKIVDDSNLDGSQFEWSLPLDKPTHRGYYHVRNATLGIEMIEEFYINQANYQTRKSITPDWEALRSIAWWWIFDEATNYQEGCTRILPVLKDLGVSFSKWDSYINHIKDIQPWVRTL